MPIPVEHEDLEALKGWGLGLASVLECCVLCRAGTRMWHGATNEPVCQACADAHEVGDLPRVKARAGASH